ncbi:MFS transporter, DHA1 family, arabinose polymer transporter [Halomonas shengliensis]|uniref:MFS transporter, DHA1 family, arabinose polymer transporter n=1 Tax=Halomonas shengliensis TaxID=419597 RepID=A0A1H0JEG4_9GAMM|nr:MFS transporter [Halomonas shengliensis]SDO41751.1 MFS transporter, DHA1 family, arabinose polymer transporter [Halomonas shengliensis]
MSTPSSAVARHPRLAELALALGGFGIGTSEFVIMGLMERVAANLAVATADVGYAISAYALGVVVGAPLISALAARVPRRALLIALMLVFALGNVASALTTAFWPFVALRFVAGLPHGAFFGVAALVAAAAVPVDQRARAIARVMLGLSAAIVVGAPLATWAGQWLGWRFAFHAVGAVALATMLMIRLCVPAQPGDRAASPRRELGALVSPRVLATLGVAAIGFGGMFAVFSYVVPTLRAQAGMPETLGPWVLTLFGLGGIVGNLVGARLADRHPVGAIPCILVWSLLVQLGFYAAANHLVTGLLFVTLVGTGIALGPALQARLMDVAGEAQTMAASMNHAAFNGANALGAWLGGATIKAGAAWSATGLVGAGLALGGLAVFALGRRLERHSSPGATPAG